MSNRMRHRTSADSPSQANGSAKGNAKNNKGKNNGHTSSSGEPKILTEKQRLVAERKGITLLKRPLTTIQYFLLECLALMKAGIRRLLNHTRYIAILLIFVAFVVLLHYIPGKHLPWLYYFRWLTVWAGYWIFLGVISSVGLGSGLHTFLLYLGPHIASVTMAAYECHSLDFPKPPYPDEIECPENADPTVVPSVWDIMAKVRFESIMWGLGTALGELPPYFVARASRLSGDDPDEDDGLKEFTSLKNKVEAGVKLTLLERAKYAVEQLVNRVGFAGILIAASIPNPLFDLAGITCGHFLVSFFKFSLATIIGKALIKPHLQMVFVILCFNEPLIKQVVGYLGHLPVIGPKLQTPFLAYLEQQKLKFHKIPADKGSNNWSKLFVKFFELFVGVMVIFFCLSIVNSFAQNYHRRLHKKSEHQTKQSNKVSKD